jgi:diguanylate cyclase (GGDEF)-like protein
MIDVDYFKRFNDTYGHVAGDHCLRSVAKVIANNARRAGELAARYGGEEFAVLLPQVDADDAHRLAERICNEVRQLNIPHVASDAASHVTISIGVANVPIASGPEAGRGSALDEAAARAGRSRAPWTILVERADKALYAAKMTGRNRAFSSRSDDRVRTPTQPTHWNGPTLH